MHYYVIVYGLSIIKKLREKKASDRRVVARSAPPPVTTSWVEFVVDSSDPSLCRSWPVLLVLRIRWAWLLVADLILVWLHYLAFLSLVRLICFRRLIESEGSPLPVCEACVTWFLRCILVVLGGSGFMVVWPGAFPFNNFHRLSII
ncbi:hypothetical protein HID58_004825 [Brassica napus]|uniref:Uncharacterized protein n=1 Tax=Brassica napus TaxID=3708 RepID=A0ABQ8E6X0_BRANA|nr:hypothetical protein HID58_004825 [Brassica napus]